jgi:hypothetical protein
LLSGELLVNLTFFCCPESSEPENDAKGGAIAFREAQELRRFLADMDRLLRKYASTPVGVGNVAASPKKWARMAANINHVCREMEALMERSGLTLPAKGSSDNPPATPVTVPEDPDVAAIEELLARIKESRTRQASDSDGLPTSTPEATNEMREPKTKAYPILHDGIAHLYDQSLKGNKQAFEDLLYLAMETVGSLTHVGRVLPLMAQEYAKKQMVWPALRSGEESLDGQMRDILKKELGLSQDLGLSGRFLSALGANQHRQIALWLVLYMRYLRKCQPPNVAEPEIRRCMALGTSSTAQQWWEAAEYILRTTLPSHKEIRDVWFPETKENKYDSHFYSEVRDGFEQAAPIFLCKR